MRRLAPAVLAWLLVASACTSTPTPSPSAPDVSGPTTQPTPAAAPSPSLLTGEVSLAPGAWELLAEPTGGTPDTIEVATTSEAFANDWSRRFGSQARPTTAFRQPLFVFFSIVVDASCPSAKIDTVALDRSAALIYGVFTRNLAQVNNCGDIAGVHTFVVAIDRSVLPSGQVTFRLERDFYVCADCGRETEQLTVNL